MDDRLGCTRNFGEEHFGAAQLGDVRRTRRLVYTANALFRHPGGTLPHKMHAPADLKALYRLMDHDCVSHDAVLAPHRHRTRQAMSQPDGVLLIVHDFTELDYTGLHSLRDLGQIGNGSGRGYQCLNSLAIDPRTRQVLGLANQRLHRRDTVPKKETREQRRQRESRESRQWKQAVTDLGSPPPGVCWVHVSDRGSDTLEYLDAIAVSGGCFVVRSQHDRLIFAGHNRDSTARKLHSYARALPAVGQRTIEVAARDGQAARTAQVSIAWAAVRLRPPQQPRGDFRNEALAVWVIRVWEKEPPPGVDGIEWLLLTNVPVVGLVEAERCIDWYGCRWIVEEFHKAQKSGCAIEQLQFTSEARLQPMIALLSVVAVMLLDLRDSSRRADAAERLASEVVEPEYVEVLSAWRYRQRRVDLTLREFYDALARLGGHQNRRRDKPPGWLVLWRGWMQLQTMLEGALALGLLKSG
jgi:Transposase DNA-binding